MMIVCWNLRSFQAGKTAFHYAAANGYAWVVIDILLCYDAEMEHCGNNDEGPPKQRRYDPDRPDNMGNTAVMLAVRRNHVQVYFFIFLHSSSMPCDWLQAVQKDCQKINMEIGSNIFLLTGNLITCWYVNIEKERLGYNLT